MMFKSLQDYQLQVKLFCEHLGQSYLAGFIIESQKKWGSNTSVQLDENSHQRITLGDSQNLYFVPQVCEQYGKEDCVKAITTLFVDLDEVPEDWGLNFEETQVPNLVIRRSDNRAYQWFYFLENPITEKEFRKYQKILSDRYKSDSSIKNPNRLARMAGVRRGDKSKDKKADIEAGLHYEVVSGHSQKMSKENLDAFMVGEPEANVHERGAIKSADRATTLPNDPLLKPGQYWDHAEDDDLGRVYPAEEAFFYDIFRGKSKGEGTSGILYRFACYLLDRGIKLSKFKKYCDDNGIPANDISFCDNEEFETVEVNANKYAKNQKAREEQHIQIKEKKQLDVINQMPLLDLFDDYKDLAIVYETELIHYYYVENEDSFYRCDKGGRLVKISKSAFTTIFQDYTKLYTKKGKKIKVNPINLFLGFKTRHFFNTACSTGYQPQGPRMYYENGSIFLNTWFSPIHKKEKFGDLTIFLTHISWLFKDQKSITGEDLKEFFLDYLAYVYCNPAPANFAWLIYARNMGLGRSFFTDLLRQLMGSENVSAPTPRIAYDQYTSWHSTKQFAVVEELTADKGFYDQLKPIISNELVAHREMHKNPSTVTNYCNMILLSNQMDCLKIAEKDRRILVVHMHQDVQEPEYYDALYRWKKNKDNIAELADFLIARNRQVDQRKMLGHAPITNAKLLMQRINKNNSLQELEERVNGLSFGKDNEFVDQKSLIESLYPNVQDAVIKYRNSIASNMQKIGYLPLFTGKKLRVAGKQERLTVFIEAKYAEKYIGECDFENVIEEYSIYKKIPIEKKEITKSEQAVILAPIVEPIRQEPQPTNAIITESVIKKSEPGVKPDKSKKPISPKKEKINALVIEARRRAEEKETGRKVPTVEDLIEIRTKRMSQKIDVSILYH